MATKVRIRLGTQRDEDACNAIALQSKYTRGFAKPSRMFAAKRAVAFQEGRVLVAEVDTATHGAKVVGFCWSCPMKPKHMPWSTLYDVGVDSAYSGQGFGKKLVDAALNCAKYRKLRLLVETSNTIAHNMYLGMGFVEYDTGEFADGRKFARMERLK